MDLNKLESKLDDALSKETTESLTNYLNIKRMEKKQTAVDWLFEQIKKDIIGIEYDYLEELQKAKEMEKKQIIEAFDEGQEYEYQYHINSAPKFDSETYYNETYKSE